jgi:Bacterial Ig domain
MDRSARRDPSALARLIRPVAAGVAAAVLALHVALGPVPVEAAPRVLGLLNIPPVGTPDAYSTPYQTRLDVDTPGVLANDIDLDGDQLETRLVSGTSHGVLRLDKDGKVRYEPDPGYSGTDSFTYRPFDGTALAVLPAAVTITVRPKPAPTPTPTPTPTPHPTPTPTPTPTPAPTPTPTPTLPLPTLPLPTMPLPTLPPPPIPTPGPSSPATSPGVPTPSPSATPASAPGSSVEPGPPSDPPASAEPSSSLGAAPGAGGTTTGGGGASGNGPDVAPDLPLLEPHAGPVSFGTFANVGMGIEWIVPSVLVTVPGFLLIAIGLTQLFGGFVWLPLARRWFRGDGRRSPAATTHPTD